MMIISFLGCYAARKNKKILLCWYLICVSLLLTLQSLAAAYLVNYSQSFQGIITQPSGSLTNGADVFVNNAVLSVYTRCCSGCDNSQVSAYTGGDPMTCNNLGSTFITLNNGYVHVRCNVTKQAQAYPQLPTITCEFPGPCLSTTQSYCWKYFDGPVPRSNFNYPPEYIDPTFCSLLAQLQQSGHPLVGFPQSGGCGGGKISSFISDVDNYFSPKMYLIGVVFALIAAVQGSVIFVGLYIICFVSRKDIDGDYDYDYEPR